MTLITMFTDASYCEKTKLAGFAVWAKCNGQTIRHAGVLREPVSDSGMAELQALVNGFAVVCSALKPDPNAFIIAQSDCLLAIYALDNRLRRQKAITRYAGPVRLFKELKNVHKFRTDFRHVRGHQGNVSKRNAVNEWVDRAARKALHEARAALVQQQEVA
jgi:ribonuclease HI